MKDSKKVIKDSKKVTKLLLKRKALLELIQNLKEQVFIINTELQENPFKGGGSLGNL